MLFLNHLTTLDPISNRIWCGRLFCGLPLLTIDINEPSLQIKHAKHDNFYFVHTNEMSHLNIQVVNQASQKNTPWNKAWANSSRKSFTIGREPGAPHAPRDELAIIALEKGSIEPKPREPLWRWPLRVEVDTGMGSRAACRRLGTKSLGL